MHIRESRSTPRERYRTQVRDEVKAIALRQLAESGPAGISVNAIAKELGVSGPALYRYFTNRDELLDELVIDAHYDLAGRDPCRRRRCSSSGTPTIPGIGPRLPGMGGGSTGSVQVVVPAAAARLRRPCGTCNRRRASIHERPRRHPARIRRPTTARPSPGRSGLSSRNGLAGAASTSTPPPLSEPYSSGVACTASSASKSAETSPEWASTGHHCSKSKSTLWRLQPECLRRVLRWRWRFGGTRPTA